jgi:2-polyprenyl-3-methyl-5-hydroxy-6-metoxy-1,4-benzoquinol methylase/uncharacterized protein YbaR (Trm112 family)
MDRRLLDILLCPVCGGTLLLADATLRSLAYSGGDREEVESGTVVCSCGRHYPVSDFVLSFASLYPPDLQREAAYWDRYYLWLLAQGSRGFHDLRLGQAPYITQGVPEPFPAADIIDRYNVHYQVAEHPLLRKGRSLLDMGVGLGWTSLHFARVGYEVTAFEPSLGPVTAAKRHAIEQGIFIEYICAALGFIAFHPGSFDNVTAFHSLHHVPDLETELRKISTWLSPGGALAIDEHVGNSRLARDLAAQVHAWAEEEVLPRYRTLSQEALDTLPPEPHSALEDSSVSQVLPLVNRLFDVRYSHPRHVFLDHYPLLYYLHTDRDLTAYRHALAIANQMQELVRRADPEGGDYITIVAENSLEEGSEIEGQGPLIEDAPRGPGEPSTQPTASVEPDQGRIHTLEAQLAEQGQWARTLETELKRKDAELQRLKATIRRLENGRVMRLLRLLPRRK